MAVVWVVGGWVGLWIQLGFGGFLVGRGVGGGGGNVAWIDWLMTGRMGGDRVEAGGGGGSKGGGGVVAAAAGLCPPASTPGRHAPRHDPSQLEITGPRGLGSLTCPRTIR